MEYRVEDNLSYKIHMIKTDKFKTVNIKIIFSKEIKKEEITLRNFLSDFLVYTNASYPTNKELCIRVQELYNLGLSSSCYRIGRFYNTDINVSFLNEKYSEPGMYEETIKFLNDIVVNPNVEGNAFNKKCFQVIKEGIKNQIESIKENTRKLSMINMLDNMGDDVYSYHTFGYLDDLNSITPESIYEYYKEFIRTSKIDIYVLGNIDFEETKRLVSNNFKFNTLKMKKCDPFIYHNKFRKIPKKVIDKMPLSQSKLSIGCKIDELSAYERNYVLPIYSMILGGGSNSKLFNKVREENSLCYYISASANKLDNVLFITSGINKENFDKVVTLIKEELKSMKLGKFDEDDMNDAKMQYIAMLEEFKDSPAQIISSYYSVLVIGNDPLDVRMEKIKKVIYDDVKEFGKHIHMDTIYLLEGDK